MIALNLSLFDVLLFLIITSLDILYYWGKKKEERLYILKYIIPILIIGTVVYLTIRGVVQDIVAIISIGILSIFYMYTFQAKSSEGSPRFHRSQKTILKKESWDRQSLETDDIDFGGTNTHIANMEIKEDESYDSDDFDEIIDEIFNKEKKE